MSRPDEFRALREIGLESGPRHLRIVGVVIP
jgi:hypothetical protein